MRRRTYVWHGLCPTMSPDEFVELCVECNPLWMLPRYGDNIRPRKHDIEFFFLHQI